MSRMVFDVGGTAIKYSVMDETLQRRNSGEIGAYLYYEKGSAQIST